MSVPTPASSYAAVLRAPFGWVAIATDGTAITAVDFLERKPSVLVPDRLASEAARQLAAYLKDPRSRFDLPLAPRGTRYQQQVWNALRGLKCGQTATYGALATRIGSGARAVGGACRRNPVPILIPCHRVVSKTGCGGYMGSTRGPWHDIKGWLLAHEAVATGGSDYA